MMRHLKRESAARFSFLMSVPIMLAAGGLSTYEMFTEVSNLRAFLPLMAIGFLTAMVVGYIAIRWLLKFLVNHRLFYFSIYCALLGGVTILVWVL
jgi:undecaprenyl-diphosphatase